MTLQSRIVALAEAIGADIKSIFSKQGDLSTLTTAQKASLVEAINELDASSPKITVGPTPPASPAVGDLWVDTN